MKNCSLRDIHFAQPGPKRWLCKHLFHCLIDLTVRTFLPCNQYAFFFLFLNFISRFEGQKGPFGPIRDPHYYSDSNCHRMPSSDLLHLLIQITPFPWLWSPVALPRCIALVHLHGCIQSSFLSLLLLHAMSSTKLCLSFKPASFHF